MYYWTRCIFVQFCTLVFTGVLVCILALIVVFWRTTSPEPWLLVRCCPADIRRVPRAGLPGAALSFIGNTARKIVLPRAPRMLFNSCNRNHLFDSARLGFYHGPRKSYVALLVALRRRRQIIGFAPNPSTRSVIAVIVIFVLRSGKTMRTPPHPLPPSDNGRHGKNALRADDRLVRPHKITLRFTP